MLKDSLNEVTKEVWSIKNAMNKNKLFTDEQKPINDVTIQLKNFSFNQNFEADKINSNNFIQSMNKNNDDINNNSINKLDLSGIVSNNLTNVDVLENKSKILRKND